MNSITGKIGDHVIDDYATLQDKVNILTELQASQMLIIIDGTLLGSNDGTDHRQELALIQP